MGLNWTILAMNCQVLEGLGILEGITNYSIFILHLDFKPVCMQNFEVF